MALFAALGFVVAEAAYGSLPTLPLYAPVSMVLLAVAVDHHARGMRRPVVLAPVVYCAALAGTIAFYYGMHVLLFGVTATPA